MLHECHVYGVRDVHVILSTFSSLKFIISTLELIQFKKVMTYFLIMSRIYSICWWSSLPKNFASSRSHFVQWREKKNTHQDWELDQVSSDVCVCWVDWCVYILTLYWDKTKQKPHNVWKHVVDSCNNKIKVSWKCTTQKTFSTCSIETPINKRLFTCILVFCSLRFF